MILLMYIESQKKPKSQNKLQKKIFQAPYYIQT